MANPVLRYLTLCFFATLIANTVVNATNTQSMEQQALVSIERLYHTLQAKPNTSMPARILWFSEQYLGKPYLLGALGEGPRARYDQFPRYRVDAFDCDTFVNTVLSLALGQSAQSFQACMANTRYANGRIAYLYRNHFMSLDWNKNNQKRGILQDITEKIKDKNNKPVAVFATTLINKANWYNKKTLSTIRLEKATLQEQKLRLAALKAKGKQLGSTPVQIAYIPLPVLLKNPEDFKYFIHQIPQGAIIEIVRPNWDLRKIIGTSLHVSHLGFAVWNNQQLYFRQASSVAGKVLDVPLWDYLKEAANSPTIKGINIQKVVPMVPVDLNCT